ncbi:hypothetical protein AB205_0202320 [Aquarana catesbeiana]|uniref:Uncharacterized protein n=1 Tax=Aquarana catesbeiana TaxID=8400 RepID=A0A2G9R588_AQUCT|nr:hypothetical protein AB205_0202320 [Aquarana catesbeiana]
MLQFLSIGLLASLIKKEKTIIEKWIRLGLSIACSYFLNSSVLVHIYTVVNKGFCFWSLLFCLNDLKHNVKLPQFCDPYTILCKCFLDFRDGSVGFI